MRGHAFPLVVGSVGCGDGGSVLQAAKLAKMKISPSEMFLSETDKYSKFDENVRSPFLSLQNLIGLLNGGDLQPRASGYSVWGSVPGEALSGVSACGPSSLPAVAAAALSRGLAKPRQGVAPELAGNATQEARVLSPGLLLPAQPLCH